MALTTALAKALVKTIARALVVTVAKALAVVVAGAFVMAVTEAIVLDLAKECDLSVVGVVADVVDMARGLPLLAFTVINIG